MPSHPGKNNNNNNNWKWIFRRIDFKCDYHHWYIFFFFHFHLFFILMQLHRRMCDWVKKLSLSTNRVRNASASIHIRLVFTHIYKHRNILYIECQVITWVSIISVGVFFFFFFFTFRHLFLISILQKISRFMIPSQFSNLST